MKPRCLDASSATLLVIGGWFLYFYAGGRAGNYLEPASEFALLLAGTGLLAVAAFNFLERRYPLPGGASSEAPGETTGVLPESRRDDPGGWTGTALAGLVIVAPLALTSVGSRDRLSDGAITSGMERRGPSSGLSARSEYAAQSLGSGLFPGSVPTPESYGEESRSVIATATKGVAPPTTRRTQAGSGWIFPVPPVLREEAARGGRVSREQSYLLPRSSRGVRSEEPANTGIALFGGLAGADAIGDGAAAPVDFSGHGAEEVPPFSLADLEEMVDLNGDGEYLLNIPQIYHSVGDEEVMAVLEGLPVEVTAQLTEEAPRETGESRHTAYRFSVDCCPTHSRGISIPLDFETLPTSYENHGWYRFHGRVRFRPESGESGSLVPSIEVWRIVPTDEPAADVVL